MFKVCHFLAMTVTTRDLERDPTQAAIDKLAQGETAHAEDNVFNKYRLSRHILHLAKTKAPTNKTAKEWLKNQHFLLQGLPILGRNPYKASKNWLSLTREYADEFFKDPALKIVVCICNNRAHPVRVPFQPWFVIVDEAGFALEADSLTPWISQDIVTILLTGDREQLQPIVTS
jgi:hypothetical protein